MPIARTLAKILELEKKYGLKPGEGDTNRQRSRRISSTIDRLSGKAAKRSREYRERNPEKIRESSRGRIRTPEEKARNLARNRERRRLTRIALEKPPSKRTSRERKLIESWGRDNARHAARRDTELSRLQKANREEWRKSLSPEQKEKEAMKSARAILRTATRRAKREYTVDRVTKGGRKKKVKKISYAMDMSPEGQDRMLQSLLKNQLNWFNNGGVLPDWDHIIADKAADLTGSRVASGYTTYDNMQFLDPSTNRGKKSNWLSPKLRKGVERAMMKSLKARNLFNPLAWPTAVAGGSLVAFSPQDSIASMTGEALIAAGDPIGEALLGGPALNRNPNYQGLLSLEERKMRDPTWSY